MNTKRIPYRYPSDKWGVWKASSGEWVVLNARVGTDAYSLANLKVWEVLHDTFQSAINNVMEVVRNG